MSEQSEKVNRGNAWNKPKVSHRKYMDNLKIDVSKISEKYSKDRERELEYIQNDNWQLLPNLC